MGIEPPGPGRPPANRARRGRLAVAVLAIAAAVGAICVAMTQAQAAPVRHTPWAYLEAVGQSPGHLSVHGWTFDPDRLSTALTVDVKVDGKKVRTLTANVSRPDVARYFAGMYRLDDDHGFAVSLPIGDGRHTVCITSHNVSYGSDITPACRTATVRESPYGYLEVLGRTPGHVSVHGWAFDPDALTTPLTVDIAVDGRTARTLTADLSRPDVVRYFAGRYRLDNDHGYSVSLPVGDGTHTVCATARNVSYGSDIGLGCRRITVRDSPMAYLEQVGLASGHLSVHGWAFDPDAPTTALAVDIAVDGRKVRTLTANVSRPDVARYYAGRYTLDNDHGFNLGLPTADGRHTVCITAHNVSYGTDVTPACRAITVHENPYGHLDTPVQTPGHALIRGWSFDTDALNTPVSVDITLDGKKIKTLTADVSRPDVARYYAGTFALTDYHGFSLSQPVADGTHTVCATARNVSYGANSSLGCRTIRVMFEPTTALATLTPTALGATVTGWSSDPDTTSPITVKITVDGHQSALVTANGKGTTHTGHNFAAALTMTSGTHTVCATGVNVDYGSKAPVASCKSVSLRLNPIGHFDTVTRAAGSDDLVVTGWATDPDTTSPIKISVVVDGGAAHVVTAQVSRPDVKRAYPAYGALHGFSPTLSTDDGEHTVCITALNVSLGVNKSLGCREIDAVHPSVPAAPRSVTAVAGFGGATVTWQAPASDGGAPVSGYVITSSPGNISVAAGCTATSATVLGLSAKTKYTFSVTATNVVGSSPGGTSPAVTTQASPPPQTSPAPVSTSRYIRNVHGASTADLAAMRSEGAADARANPSGHGYLILLDIGGQDQYDGGVVLSATTRFVSYADLVSDLNSYVAGYASAQKSSAPVTIAIGTNNDMDVTSAAGTAWADKVVDPVAAHAGGYAGITIAGANDIEPGFRGTYSQTSAWLTAYLHATTAPFVFNGSADGCAWTSTGRGCNNGWTMSGLYHLAAGAAPIRTINLPQIYNSTMAAQWKYISLTGVAAKQPRINFGGALTEWTACDQASSCFSLTGNQAWRELWDQLQSSPTLKVASLPYSTDLRIDS